MKFINAIFLTPFLVCLVSSMWADILLLVPSYWPIKGFMEAVLGNGFMIYIGIGVIYFVSMIVVLVWLFTKKVL